MRWPPRTLVSPVIDPFFRIWIRNGRRRLDDRIGVCQVVHFFYV